MEEFVPTGQRGDPQFYRSHHSYRADLQTADDRIYFLCLQFLYKYL